LKKDELINHLQSLRSLAYSVLQSLIIGNSKLGALLIEDNKFVKTLANETQTLAQLIGN
jgi:hypothetical protein